ncbi:MAG TPA: DUF3515 domain-containing protein [Nocardioides sp.]|uniref:DUF3515 domain-containing protein n=1 Tax=Nocardioides sp. TaxID=35761 RepID=UPI002C0985E5|nr:DUF3515 domain-containing protein [Nocardioides sp.]HQR28140.1 DUF3515 domain-containing protein [Nocardioides sp.]
MSRRTRGVATCGLLAATLALAGCESDKVPLDSPTPSPVVGAACQRLLDALPDTVDDELRRPVDPEDALGAAWGDPAITLTCGGTMPPDFDRFAACEEADGVGWYVPEEQVSDQGLDVVMTTIGRRPVVQVRVPSSYRPAGPAAAMVDLAPAIKEHTRLRKPCV